MTRFSLVVAAALASVMCGSGNAQQRVAHEKSTEIDDLKGKIVAVALMSDSEDLVLLSGVFQRTIGGKQFLCGNGVDDGETPDWRNGAVVYVPMDDIQQLVTFRDLKSYQKNLDARGDRLEGKAASSHARRMPRT